MARIALGVLWPSFLVAALGVGCFFSLFEPDALWDMPAMAVYTIGFFFFWVLAALASLLSYYLLTVPDDLNPPF